MESNELVLKYVDGPLFEHALMYWENKEIEKVMTCMSNEAYIAFVVDNLHLLLEQDNGIYERALYSAVVSTKTNHSLHSFDLLRHLMQLSDKKIMLSFGDELPEGNSFTLYRGVSGRGSKRRLRGLSWTSDFEQAKWFAERYGLEKPMVYKSEIDRDFVFCFTQERNESEMICLLPKDHPIKMCWRSA